MDPMGATLSRFKGDGVVDEKVERAYLLLGVPRTATLREIKTAYGKQCYRNRHDDAQLLALNGAIATVQDSVPLEIYTEAFLAADYALYAADFFERLTLCYGLHPRLEFGDPDFPQFYRYWCSFRHKDKALEQRVLSVIKRIKALDPRYKRSEPASTPRDTPPAKVTEKRAGPKAYKLYCRACSKGFNNENTLRDHLRSKLHSGNIEAWVAAGNDPADVCSGIGSTDSPVIQSADGSKSSHAESNLTDLPSKNMPFKNMPLENMPFENMPSENMPSENAVVKDESTVSHSNADGQAKKVVPDSDKREHEAFRTCSLCKEVFDTRGRLIMHIKQQHSSAKAGE
ncbi:hypothetical protein PAPHI01_1454 [Pancytospora philotis]|nr:hypothetical protein PAPHI01_1454 [Pancytospora philotis]